MSKKLAPIILIIILSFFAWRPLINRGFFAMHDNQQVVRLAQLDKSLSFGQFPVRWVEDLGFGMGYPLFNFYPPLVYYMGEVFRLGLGIGFIDSLKLVWFVALVGSGITMYFLAKEFFGKTGGIVAAIFYLYAPYHATDAFVRGALAELFSFVWLPLILLFAYKAMRLMRLMSLMRPMSLMWTAWTGVTLALLMLTHNLIFLPFAGFYVLWCLLLALAYRKNIVRSFVFCLLSFVFCLGLTAFFWLPALWEKQYTLVDSLLIKNLASYKIHFLCWWQLFNSSWGYGGSGAGCIDGMSFNIGRLHLLLASFALPLGWLFVRSKKDKSIFYLLSSIFFLLLISAFMTTSYSKIVWDYLPPLWYLQFPWRFVTFAVLFASLLTGAFIAFFRIRLVKILAAMVLLAVVIARDGRFFVPQSYLPQATDEELTSDYETKWVVSSTSFEYLPKGMATRTTELGTVWIDIDEQQLKTQSSKFKAIRGGFLVERQDFVPHKFRIVGNSTTGAELQLNIANFPGWKVWIDGKETAIDDNNKYKLLTVAVPAGKHIVRGEFTNTPVRTVGNIISLVSFGLVGSMLWKLRK